MKNNGDQAVSVEQILQTIRGVITGNNSKEDVLELTEIVKDSEINNQTNNIKLDDNENIKNMIDRKSSSNDKEDKIVNQNIDGMDLRNKQQTDSLYENGLNNNELKATFSRNDEVKSDDALNKTAKNIMLSEETVAETSEALKNLVRTVSKPVSDGLSFRNGTSLEELIIEILKPYLKEWLDKNLPSIVKHIVEKEVQKLIPKDED